MGIKLPELDPNLDFSCQPMGIYRRELDLVTWAASQWAFIRHVTTVVEQVTQPSTWNTDRRTVTQKTR